MPKTLDIDVPDLFGKLALVTGASDGVGLEIAAQCQFLADPEQGQTLLVLTATPGTPSYERLQLLSVIGTQEIAAGR
jgi:NAD(P)-dependent dehydrogenase (short-subunit alcohol dehydrogenase family)